MQFGKSIKKKGRTKMKFYYNGKLVRTSKTHEYHYAIVKADGSKARSCHGTLKAAQNEMNRVIAEYNGAIASLNERRKALQNGRKFYFIKNGRREYKYIFTENDTVEDCDRRIEEVEEGFKWFTENWKIVELQAEA